MATHKVPITVRIEPQLLERVRHCAEQDNRTLTNFIETALRERVKSRGQLRIGRVRSAPAVRRSSGAAR